MPAPLSVEFEDEQWDYPRVCERDFPSAPNCTDMGGNFFTFFGFNQLAWHAPGMVDYVAGSCACANYYLIIMVV